MQIIRKILVNYLSDFTAHLPQIIHKTQLIHTKEEGIK